MTHIIIDGYNLIRQSPKLILEEALNLERGRLSLINKLAAYKKLKGHRITVVFDAAKTSNLSVERDRIAGIHILYSEMGQTADEVIMNLAQQEKDRALVVSSDNQILRAAKLAGCGILQSPEFESKLNEALMYSEKGIERESDQEKRPLHKRWVTKKKGPSKRAPKAKRKAMRKLEKL